MKKNIYKGHLQSILLKILSEGEKMYGYQITQVVKAKTKGELTITEGALYPMLHDLENKHFIEAENQIVNGRLRKYYKITDNGITEQSIQEAEVLKYLHQLKTLFES